MHNIIRRKVYLHLASIDHILSHLRAAKLIEHRKLDVRVLSQHVLLLVQENHVSWFPLLLSPSTANHDELLIVLHRGAIPVDWREILNLKQFPLLVDGLLVQVESLYSLLSKSVHQVLLLTFFDLNEFAETNIFALEVEGIEDPPVLVLLKVRLACIQKITALILPAESKD